MSVLVLLPMVGVGMQQCMIWNQNEMHKLSKVNYDANMQLTINCFRPLFPDKIFPDICLGLLLVISRKFPRQLSNFLTFPCFPDKWSPCSLKIRVCIMRRIPQVTLIISRPVLLISFWWEQNTHHPTVSEVSEHGYVRDVKPYKHASLFRPKNISNIYNNVKHNGRAARKTSYRAHHCWPPCRKKGKKLKKRKTNIHVQQCMSTDTLVVSRKLSWIEKYYNVTNTKILSVKWTRDIF